MDCLGLKAKLEPLCRLAMSWAASTPIPLAHRGTRALSASRFVLVTTKPYFPRVRRGRRKWRASASRSLSGLVQGCTACALPERDHLRLCVPSRRLASPTEVGDSLEAERHDGTPG